MSTIRAIKNISGVTRNLILRNQIHQRFGARSSLLISYTQQYHQKQCRQPTLALVNNVSVRHYSDAPAPLTRDFVLERIVDTLKGCDKIDEAKITATANLSTDLGLDSLDVVDVLFFIEEEFGIEIPDEEANELHSVDQIADYILAQPDAY